MITENTQQTILNILQTSGNQKLMQIAAVLPQSTFFTARCHSHHRYRGGLADHALGVTQELLSNNDLEQRYGRDNLIFAGMFHDLCKAWFGPWQCIHGHGRRSVKILGDYFHVHLHDDVYDAIRNHMHHSNPRYNPLWAALHRADHVDAARNPQKSINFGI